MKKIALSFLLFFIIVIPKQALAAQKIPILIYHHIDEYQGIGSKQLYVTPENFEKQIKYLQSHGFTLFTFENWKQIDEVKKPIFLTFDDGYKDNLQVLKVFQDLKQERFQPRATFFIISDFVGRANRLTKSDLLALTKTGMISIQSHTATHPDLTNISHYEYELKGSMDTLEQLINKKVIALAYPYGNFNNRVVEETKKYSFGLTTTPELYTKQGRKDELFLLPRIYVKFDTTIEEFAELVEGH
ncbi:polysaccharide deacetylase family protein [Cytobacillus sp. Hz8]|uniref:polysaccharide deacetylase family protein n=1 Tax=Cytobacillus sp. Hz8 TaxID=3347168 RepID=UPI0035E2853E